MDLTTLQKRLLLLAAERLINRQLDLAALQDEFESPLLAMEWQVPLAGVLVRGNTLAFAAASSAYDADLLALIDAWADRRGAPDIAPLPPHEPATPAQRRNARTITAAESPKERRAKHDMTSERGCRRLILEHWDEIEKLHGPGADGRQVLQVLKRAADPSEKMPVLKTVRNKLAELRNEKLIP